MSFQAMAWAITQRPKGSKEKFVLLMLANYASSEDGKCFPSVNKIADETMMSRDSVIRALKALEDDGFITIKRRSSEGVNLPNYYTLNLQGVVAHSDQGSSTQLLGVVAPCDHNLSYKPINEPKPSKKATRLGSDFVPDMDFPSKLGLNHSKAHAEFEKFKDYWAAKAGRDGSKLDWQATWRNWIRGAAERNPTSPSPQQIDWQKRLAYYEEKGTWAPAWGPKPGEIGCKAPLNGRSFGTTSQHQNSLTTSELNA